MSQFFARQNRGIELFGGRNGKLVRLQAGAGHGDPRSSVSRRQALQHPRHVLQHLVADADAPGPERDLELLGRVRSSYLRQVGAGWVHLDANRDRERADDHYLRAAKYAPDEGYVLNATAAWLCQTGRPTATSRRCTGWPVTWSRSTT